MYLRKHLPHLIMGVVVPEPSQSTTNKTQRFSLKGKGDLEFIKLIHMLHKNSYSPLIDIGILIYYPRYMTE